MVEIFIEFLAVEEKDCGELQVKTGYPCHKYTVSLPFDDRTTLLTQLPYKTVDVLQSVHSESLVGLDEASYKHGPKPGVLNFT